jgi:type I restriction enzyme M protein
MALKKSELYSSLWKSCDELRGGMDASQYKDYVLVLLFVKYVTDKHGGRADALIEVPPGGGFADLVALKNQKEIGDGINKAITRLAEANDLGALFGSVDFNDEDKLGKGKDMVDRLTKLVGIFEGLDFRRNRADGDDLLGDAYEYLMRNFATESGKSKGQFYTPAEVSRIMARVIGVGEATSSDQTIHDPACGSGSLLLKAHDEAKSRSGLDLALYGQEMDNATASLARMNMILHDCPAAAHDIHRGNTLSSPELLDDSGQLKRFDFVVANPPFSTKAWSTGILPAEDRWERFKGYGIPPEKNGDYAFLLHILACLKSTGKGGVILPHGVLFRGNAEAAIRRNIVRRGYLRAIIGLPANLFYGTGIPACILVLDKQDAAARSGIFMIDASKGFRKDGNKNRLREQDIHRIVDIYARQRDVPGYSRMVPLAEIADPKNDYNLNLPRYIDSSEPEDLQDLTGHLQGGIPERDVEAMAAYWEVCPALRAALFQPLRPGYLQLAVPAGQVKESIFAHPEFTAFKEAVTRRFTAWRGSNARHLHGFDLGGRPKALIEALSEDLLSTFHGAPLLDPYDVYQHLMDYWAETLQDDCHLIAGDGWLEAARPQLMVDDKAKKSKPDLVVGRRKFQCELIPPALLTDRYFPAERDAIAAAEAELAGLEQQMEELAEEHGGEEGLLVDAANDKGKITKASVAARLTHIHGKPDFDDERALLKNYKDLIEREAAASDRLKKQQTVLAEKVLAKFAALTVDEIKALAVEDKWLATLAATVQGEIDRVSQTLTGRIRLLAERYAAPLPQLVSEVDDLAAKVAAHLAKMGLY